MKWVQRLSIMLAVIITTQVQARPLPLEQVPEPLQPWIDWVLLDSEDYRCPFLYNSFRQKRCSWPSRLNLDIQDEEGHFVIHWQVYSESWIQLPGNDRHWPQNVTVNQKPALAMLRKGRPVIRLQKGSYTVAGDFYWDFVPDNLAIPRDSGVIRLTVKGKTIASPELDSDKGQLWLKNSDTGSSKPANIRNELDLQVFRKVIDAVPLQVLTHLDLQVSGEQREVQLPSPLLDGFIAMRLNSPLPARLQADGSLLLQVRPGKWQIDVLARYTRELQQLPLQARAQPWPRTEIWSFAARPNLRLVEIENLPAIDPRQTNLPAAWKKLPAYRIRAGEAMAFKTVRRGDPQPEPNALNLQRQIWLDFNGRGYTIHDSISGTMTRGWRLNVLPEMQLGQVELDGRSQLVTYLPGTQKQGVEVRRGLLQLSADSRVEGGIGKLGAVGWEEAFNQVRAELNLPPGWHLLAASGVDNVPESWISRWTLLDLFLVLIASLAIARLWNAWWGLFALLTLGLIWHEPQAPRYIWLNILAATALLTVLQEGRFYTAVKLLRNVFWLALLLLVIPFLIDQVRIGLYPQLEKPWQNIVIPQNEMGSTTASLLSRKQAGQQLRKNLDKARGSMARPMSPAPEQDYLADYAMSESGETESADFMRIDPRARIQTGPGLPQWQWRKIHLSWNGPLDAGQQLRFWYLSPLASMLLNFLRVVLVSVLSLLLFGLLKKNLFTFFRSAMFSKTPLLLCAMLLPMLLPAGDVHAQFPDQAMLDELQKRILRGPDCLPDCAQIGKMQLSIDARKLTIELQVHAQQAVALPLPAQYRQWFPSRVLVDDKIAEGLFRDKGGKLWLYAGKGIHRIVLSGRVPALNNFFLPLPLKPHRVTINSEGWLVEGVHEHQIADRQLQFSRKAAANTKQSTAKVIEQGILPPFVQMQRTLQLGLDWRLVTRIRRITPADSAIALEIPLLPGEAVLTPGVRVEQGKVLVNMLPRQKQVVWLSRMQKQEKIDLQAADTDLWAETWRVDASPIWHLQTSGIAVVHHQDSQGRWLPEWRPWPGEKVSLTITRPGGVPGQTLTLDKSRLQIRAGRRAMQVTLVLDLRSSQGGQHAITLPEKAQLQIVKIDGISQPVRQKGRQLTLPVKPGKQEISIIWRQTEAIESLLKTPLVDLHMPGVNSQINLTLGNDRWLLFTAGPRFGPAVLFWGVLAILVIMAIALGRISLTPLRTWQWLLLLIGLSQIPLAGALLVVAWLIVLGVRGGKNPKEIRYFNAAQIALGLLTLAALLLLFLAIRQGLLGAPDMQISGNQSSAFNLNWYQDRSVAELPRATVISVPLLYYRLAMLAWSLWLAVALLNWLKWGWSCFAHGNLWIKSSPKKQQQRTLLVKDKKAEK